MQILDNAFLGDLIEASLEKNRKTTTLENIKEKEKQKRQKENMTADDDDPCAAGGRGLRHSRGRGLRRD